MTESGGELVVDKHRLEMRNLVVLSKSNAGELQAGESLGGLAISEAAERVHAGSSTRCARVSRVGGGTATDQVESQNELARSASSHNFGVGHPLHVSGMHVRA